MTDRPVALVTGAARRLGREISLTLAAQGWAVAVHYATSGPQAVTTASDCSVRSAAHTPLTEGLDALQLAATFEADLADEASTRALVPQVAAHFGRLDAVINSASVFEHDDAASFGHATMARHWQTNTAAPILLAKALEIHLRERTALADATPEPGQACVVNLLDQKLWNPNPDFLSYTLSKAALEAATTLLAQALAPTLRVVGVAPGLTLPSPYMNSPEHFESLHRLSPLGRSSTPADVADAVAFALRNKALTGTTLLVDGGQHLMKFERDFSHMPQA
ncbi:MAG: 3-oxoacyl-[acyl-carrier-protein] reductase FabG [Paracidovorax wautersii]|uniref:3-oxoacyl-[acyl-carrier-protein] reductase FabG n=1 Tax=Paracidovorax wautersii TaxID=1177982 RepID=A0A7V8JRQ1_9BURK|nr:MAG: 3-oxoacyl-[acyl-carrier-protein] reductase FabG [Paracidovorax wautersii]